MIFSASAFALSAGFRLAALAVHNAEPTLARSSTALRYIE
jgi:hypothetical protein